MDDASVPRDDVCEQTTPPSVRISESLKLEISSLYPTLVDRGVLHVMSGEDRLMTLRLTAMSETSIGRSINTTFPLQHDVTLSRLHFVIFHEESGFSLETRSTSRPTLHNGVEVRGRVLLSSGDTIQAGASQFLFVKERFVEESSKEHTAMPVSERTPLLEEEVEPLAFLIPEPFHLQPLVSLQGCESVLIGRSSRADVHLDESNVSGKHCILRRVPSWSGEGIYTIEDLASRNGTTIQRPDKDAPILKLGAHPQRLEHGMRICLGEAITYRFITRVNHIAGS